MAEALWRPLALTDAPLVAALLAGCEAADGIGVAVRGAEGVREDLSAPGIDLNGGTTSVWSGGEPAAYATTRIREHAEPAHQLTLDIAVHPAHRTPSMIRQLLDWCQNTGARRHRELYDGTPLELHVRTHHGQAWLAEALDTAGYRRERSYWGMRLDLDSHRLIGAPAMPTGTEIVPFDDAFDAKLLAARNAIFADNWGSAPMTARTWRHSITASPYFRPESSFLLLSERNQEILCYLLCTELVDTCTDRELYLANAGTQPALHGKGLYRAVFTHTLARAKAQGYRWAVLDVDATNPMAAGGFYERRGLRRFRTWTTHVLTCTPPSRLPSPEGGRGAPGAERHGAGDPASARRGRRPVTPTSSGKSVVGYCGVG
ncbi:GNAT family N-acetyltransferase [Streptomyces sp. NPDC048637]|uniref:GNAT family N-acetyltransferase n=1 Tax=Streptomyces sp. NPDC048637 TaxID=3155636 RepID=UPI0034275E07